MPEFAPGEIKTAKATMRNPSSKAFAYEGIIYMGSELSEVSRQLFSLSANEEKLIDFPITMPAVSGTYPVHIGVFSGGQNIGLYRSTEDVQISQLQPSVEVIKGYIRVESPTVSEAFSGWVGIPLRSTDVNLAVFGSRVQIGAIIHNNTSLPLIYGCTLYNYHWVELPPPEYQAYVREDFVLPSVEPVKFTGTPEQGSPPTGLPFSSYMYECDMFLPAGVALPPGKTGFVYTDLFSQSRRWNFYYLQVTHNSIDLGTTELFSGWYSY